MALDEFRHLKIQLEDIKSATDNFSDNNFIGEGGFGKVYKGEISHSKGESMAAFKRLDSEHGQGNTEFWKEILMLSHYTHENLVSLLGYCDECDEKILVYELASLGSLDRYLSATTLTWTQRLKICLGAARGLSYLHDPKETQQRVLHRDIKSANILLDENWNVKVSDFGLSKIGPANQQYTLLISNVVGTPGYCDPLYMEEGFLTKESDVYSFGVVLFEVLCGSICLKFSDDGHRILVPFWKEKYKNGELDEIILQDLKQHMDQVSLETFSEIAYRCLQRSREERPNMVDVVKQLEIALECQIHERWELPTDTEYVLTTAAPELIYRSKGELKMLLSNGILLNHGKTWFSLNKYGEHCEMISAAEFLISSASSDNKSPQFEKANSRFAEGSYVACYGIYKAHVRTRSLSKGIVYTVNLVCKFRVTGPDSLRLSVKYKLQGETKYSTAYPTHKRQDGWMMAELYQFTCKTRDFELEILFDGSNNYSSLIVEGIEFRPVEIVEHEEAEDEKVDRQPISDSDIWEQLLPNDYDQIIKWVNSYMEWTTKKELYFLFCKGFLINNGAEWFFLAKNGKKCHMLSAKAAFHEFSWRWQSQSLPKSRFEDVGFAPSPIITIRCKIRPQLTSPQTTYACYLVYNITENHSDFEGLVMVSNYGVRLKGMDKMWFSYLLGPQTPVIKPRVDPNTHNLPYLPKIKGLPQLRNDGWMEVQVWEFQTGTTTEIISIHFDLQSAGDLIPLDGLIVQGIEFKPV